MRNFFLKREIKTSTGISLLFLVAVIFYFLINPINKPLENKGDEVLDNSPKEEVIDITRQGVHENASPDEACRVGQSGDGRDVLVSTFKERGLSGYSGKTWVPEEDLRSLFPNIQSKIDVMCVSLRENDLELFYQAEYTEGVWIDEGTACDALWRFCGVSIDQPK